MTRRSSGECGPHVGESGRAHRLPDFYAVGAPRCGTTAIYEVLRHQEHVFLPMKEPRFWCDDLDSGSPADGLFFTRRFEDYAALYAAAPSGHSVGDMSTWYLFSQNAVPRIVATTPDARFIVGVRNPVDLMRSLHATRVAGLSEDIVDFGAALEAEDDRLRGHRIPPNVRNRSGLLYRRVASTGDQLRRLANLVPRRQIHLYVFEDFRDDPAGTISGILQFLDLPPLSADETVPVINRRSGVRRLPLRTLLMTPGKVIWAKKFIPAPIRRPIRKLIDATTLGRGDISANVSAVDRADLLESFRDDIAIVSEFTGRDMWSFWSRPSNRHVAAHRE